MSEKLIKKKSSWKYKSFLVVIVLLLLSFIAIFMIGAEIASKDKQNTNIAEDINKISVSLKFISDERERSFKLIDISKQSTVFDILKESVEIEYNDNYDYGVFIESIDGINNGDDGKYWQYYINDKLGDVAADKKNLENGDEVEWRFEDVSRF